jgi:signal transduction histidine kinase
MSAHHRKERMKQRSADEKETRPQATRQPPRAAARLPAAMELAGRRVEHLYEISKLLANFESLKPTVSAALAFASATLPLLSAVLIEATDDRTSMTTWYAQGHTDARIAKAKAHAQTAYAYLVGTASAGAREPIEPIELSGGHDALTQQVTAQLELKDRKRFIVLPLVVAETLARKDDARRRLVFGALQLEGATSFQKADLLFVNAIANQLAIALDRHRAWQRDIALRERAEEATQMRDRILAVVSHDLRNPLATILMTTGFLAKDGVPEAPRNQVAAIERIERAARHMQRLIGDLLDFASIQVGQLAITRMPREPASLISEAIASFAQLAQEKRLHLESEAEAELSKVDCDRERILQVFSNLIGNALKVTASGGSIILRAAAHEREVLFAVSDTGPGIADKDLKHLFERHWRSSDPGYKGTGLGLHIAKGIVEAHDGRIWAESNRGQGATFFFTIPALDGTDPPAPGAEDGNAKSRLKRESDRQSDSVPMDDRARGRRPGDRAQTSSPTARMSASAFERVTTPGFRR